eukprot:455779_1
MSNLAQINNPTKAGFLEKQSLYLGQYRKRYMVLKDNKLFSFKNTSAKQQPTEVFDLKVYHDIKTFKDGFILSSDKISRKFKCNILQKKKWIQSLKTTIMNYVPLQINLNVSVANSDILKQISIW